MRPVSCRAVPCQLEHCWRELERSKGKGGPKFCFAVCVLSCASHMFFPQCLVLVSLHACDDDDDDDGDDDGGDDDNGGGDDDEEC